MIIVKVVSAFVAYDMDRRQETICHYLKTHPV
jgi:hypothetical protein